MSTAFRERARLEAERYGADPWIFVRELLQNARDAGATQVELQVSDGGGAGGAATVLCRDDGEGMTFEHARRYLFALYASSKEARANQVGKFGVGFWSILRFEPTSITIRSRSRHGPGWGVVLDGRLESATAAPPLERVGTEIVLRRPAGDGGLAKRVHDAVWQSARFLRQRDDPRVPLAMSINGQRISADFALPAPSASFRRGLVRGVVGLGPAPRVELFSRGLRVRSAASLEDLLSATGRHSSWLRVQFTELPGGLAPQALLESPEVEVMLARSDARDTRALRQLVRLAQRELERLIERHLAAARPLSWWSRLGGWLGDRLRTLSGSTAWWAAGVLVAAAAVVAVASRVLEPSPLPAPVGRAPLAASPEVATGQGRALPAARTAVVVDEVFEDPGGRYDGPSVDTLGPEALEPVGLRYRPASGRHHFSVLTFSRLAADGSPISEPVARPVAPYPGATCRPGSCLQIELPLRARSAATRIPVPTGHRVVEGSLTLGAERPRLQATFDGRPVVVFSRPVEGVLRYRTAPAPDPRPPAAPGDPTAAALPGELGDRVRQLRGLTTSRQVEELLALTRQRVSYDASAPTIRRHRELIAAGQGFLSRALAVGAGDCDVQNGVLTALLQAAGVPARLAVGYLGERGRVLPWHHAWVEYADDSGRWSVADASATSGGEPRLAAARLSVGTPASTDEEAPPATSSEAERDPPPRSSQTERDPPPPSRHVDQAPRLLSPRSGERTGEGSAASPLAPRSVPPWLAWSALALSILLFSAWLLLGGRTRRAFKLDPGADLSRLLRGVLQQPAAFGHIPALFHRPLVPLADGRAISISRARELASRSRLFFTAERAAPPPLVRDALRAGAAVLDHASEEGQVVADALGAIDLDLWARMISTAREPALLSEVNGALRRHGEAFVVRGSPTVAGGLATLDLQALGARLPGVRGSRLVLVDSTSEWFQELERYHRRRPQAAVFLVLEELARRLDLRPPARRRLLGVTAREAVLRTFAP